MLPDAYFYPIDPARQMADMGNVDIILALSQVPDRDVSKYGICEVDDDGWVTKMLEKPSSEETTSRWAITGRYRLSAKAAELLIEYVTTGPINQTEIDMSGYFALAIERGIGIACCFLDWSHKRFDCGDPDGYRQALEAFGK
jgi:UTP-glucose-1-phosphate uridylyltransferase